MCSIKNGVPRNFRKFKGKRLCQKFFFNKVAGQRTPTLLKKSLWHRCFPVSFAKFLRTPLLQNTSGRLLLESLNLHKFDSNFLEHSCRQGICSSHLTLCLTLNFIFGYCSRACPDLKITVYIFCWYLLARHGWKIFAHKAY